MKKAFGVFIIIIILLGIFSCKDSLIVTNSDQSAIDIIKRFKNVPWILKSATAGDSALPFYLYDNKFTFLFNDTAIFGYDGCNWFDGKFKIEKGCFNIIEVWQTAMACYPRKNFDACMLFDAWNFAFTETSFTLFKADTIFKYSSEYTHSLSNCSFTNKTWKLTSTNDDKYSYLESVGYIFKINLSTERTTTVRKVNTYPTTEYDCIYSSIYFGIGLNNSIFFFDRRYTPSCIGSPPPAERMSRDLISDLLTATNYSTTNTTLTLTRISDGRLYTFSLEE